PDANVRTLYAGQVAAHVGLPVEQLVRIAQQRNTRPSVRVAPTRRIGTSENAEFVAVALLLQRWDDIAPWLVEPLFSDELSRRAFLALADAHGVLDAALELADPDARELLERAAVADLDADPTVEARSLLSAAVRRELAHNVRMTDGAENPEDADARRRLHQL
ncbi:unnamed protein product, partial [Phaeothamnion confervicola]